MEQETRSDLKEIALVAELARPLAHECNNFLNNFLLQLAIAEKSLPEAARPEWTNLKREAKKLANLFQQWQRQRRKATEEPVPTDIHLLIQQMVTEMAPAPITVRAAAEPHWVKGFAADLEHLLIFLLRYAREEMQRNGPNGVVQIQVGKTADRIAVRLWSTDAEPALGWADFDGQAPWDRATLSLLALACKSLVERLEGHVCLEGDETGAVVLALDLPQAIS